MSVTITSSAGGSTVPALVVGAAWSRVSGNARHDPIGATFPLFTLRQASSRRGTLQLLYPDEASAIAAEALHAAAATFTLVDDEDAAAGMVYAVDEGGAIALELDQDTQRVWILSITFAQVG